MSENATLVDTSEPFTAEAGPEESPGQPVLGVDPHDMRAPDEDMLPAGTEVLRLRGLPFTANTNDVRDWFAGYPIAEEHGAIVVVTHGFHRGEGYVKFASAEACMAAYAALNRQNMGGRYIELYASTPGALELQRAAQEQILSEHRYFVRLRGLPFQAGDGNVREFFAPLGQQVVLSVHLCTGADGRFNGNAFVELSSDEAVRQALLHLNKGSMGSRYIEIFESSMTERDAALNAERRRRRVANVHGGPFGPGGQRGGFGGPPGGYYGGPQPMQMQHQQYQPQGFAQAPPPQQQQQTPPQGFQQQQNQRPAYPVIRIRGLPFSANESTIADFLTGVNIPAQGVHMVYNADERPTGEAFVEVCSEADVQAALAMHHGTLGRRYIEVFRSSQGEMQRLQMGEAPVPEGYYGQQQQQQQQQYRPQQAPPYPNQNGRGGHQHHQQHQQHQQQYPQFPQAQQQQNAFGGYPQYQQQQQQQQQMPRDQQAQMFAAGRVFGGNGGY